MNPWREEANEMNYPLSDRDGSGPPMRSSVSGAWRVVGMIAEHLTTLPEKPVFRSFSVELAAKYLDSKPPELGEADDILAAILYLTNPAHR
ncbi:MAG TPA: hypothetical protein VNZ53_32035 [Steroidobacteraceae bacterium]|jgi:hypothetical protein|nr:hypothetical protein [Steroidobacteraceae bacterium]